MADQWVVQQGGGDWNVASNWSNHTVPGSQNDNDDDVNIITSSFETIFLDDTITPDGGNIYYIGQFYNNDNQIDFHQGRMVVLGAETQNYGFTNVDQGFELDFEGPNNASQIVNGGIVTIAGTFRPGADTTLSGGGAFRLAGGSIEGIGLYGLESNNTIAGLGKIDLYKFTNDSGGSVQADGGTLTLNVSTTVTNDGELGAASDGSTLDIEADVDNTNGSIVAPSNGEEVLIGAHTITGGTVEADQGVIDCKGATLDGLTVGGDVYAEGRAGLTLEGSIEIDRAWDLGTPSSGSVKLAGGQIVSSGTDCELLVLTSLFGTGTIGDGHVEIFNDATIEASSGNLVLALGDPAKGTNFNEAGAKIIAAKNSTISIDEGDTNGATFDNNGTLIAYTGGSVYVGSIVDMTNFSGSQLVGGTYEALGNGATIGLGQTFSSLDATIILSGAGSIFESAIFFSQPETLESMLSTIAKDGKLEVLGGRDFQSTAPTFTVQGTLEMSGGLFQMGGGTSSRLTVQSAGDVELAGAAGVALASGSRGYASVYKGARLEKLSGGGTSTVGVAVANGGVIIAGSGVLDLAANVNGAGRDYVEKGATLEFAGAVAKTQAFDFATGGGKLLLADAGQFAGTIGRLGAGDTIDIDGLGSGTSFSFVENAGKTQGVLTLKHGSTIDRLTLAGNYASSGFKLTNGTSSDTLVTYVAPKPQQASDTAAPPSRADLAQSLFDAALLPAATSHWQTCDAPAHAGQLAAADLGITHVHG